MKSPLKKLAGFKNKLTRLNEEEPVTKLALAVILLLDIFILSVIFGGLDDHTAQLTSPNEYFPHQCRQVFIQDDWTDFNKVDKLQQFVLVDRNNYSYRHDSPYEKSRIAKMHPECRKFFEQISLIEQDAALKGLFTKRQQAVKKKSELVRKYDRENEVYDTKLLEKIADTSSGDLDAMARSMQGMGKRIDQLKSQINELNAQIGKAPLVRTFWELARVGDDTRRQELIDDLNRYERVYLFRELLWQLLFLLPLLALFILWHGKSLKKDRNIQSLISAHLLIVAAIPILMKLVEMVLELIPHHFFKELFDLLERLRLVAIWHYVVIALTIGAALLFVYIIQKKIFNKERMYEKRLAKGACCSCGKKLPGSGAVVCPFCSTKQYRTCSGCGADTYLHAAFCTSCGQESAKGE